MKPIKTLSRRSLIKVVSVATAGFLVTLGFAVSGYVLASRYKLTVENQYNRALDDLGYYSSSIGTALTKGMYAGTNRQFALFAAKLATDAAEAKNALGSLPQGEIDLSGTYKFLSQVGDYAMALTRKVADGGRITADEWKNLRSLTGYAQKMSEEVEYMRSLVMDDDYLNGMVHRTVEQAQKKAEEESQAAPVNNDVSASASSGQQEQSGEQPKVPSFGESFDEMEGGFDGYPSLLYDGPFSEHIAQQTAALTEGKPEISAEKAIEVAAKLTGRPAAELGNPGEENGKIPSFCFYTDQGSVTVTKKGGFGVYCTMQRDVGEEKLRPAQAIQKAKEYLASIGYDSMTSSYYFTTNGVCTVNFAYRDGNVTVYPDLIKVNVALDNGDILGFDARGFIMNHKERDLPRPAITKANGLYTVSPMLKVESAQLTVIPSSGNKELLCYEYKCTGQEGEQVLVYVNAQNGSEEQIMILLRSDNGTLTV